jgi:hypothetical protein
VQVAAKVSDPDKPDQEWILAVVAQHVRNRDKPGSVRADTHTHRERDRDREGCIYIDTAQSEHQ